MAPRGSHKACKKTSDMISKQITNTCDVLVRIQVNCMRQEEELGEFPNADAAVDLCEHAMGPRCKAPTLVS